MSLLCSHSRPAGQTAGRESSRSDGLGLLVLGYDVYVAEELVFSSSRNVDAAIARMKAEGAVFLTYKSLYYELIEAVEGGRHRENVVATFGPFPDDLPDAAVQ